VESGVQQGTDMVVRPEYDGALVFSAIREANSPETYSWRVKLSKHQNLVLADEHDAEVRYDSGEIAYLINAPEAHDATGAAVATSLSVQGDVITL